MDATSIAKAITRAVLVTLVLAVIGFSLLVDPNQVFFALAKGFLTLIFGWIFIIILSDAIVKSIASSALEAQASRKDGGMIYHFLKPDANEVNEDGTPVKGTKAAAEKSK